MSKTIVITQSNYLPWRGYFDLIHRADLLIFLDSVQYTRRDWRNRNQIKTTGGPHWMTIPVEVKGKYQQAVDQTVVSDPEWARDHRRVLEAAYKRSPAFASEAKWLFGLLDSVTGEPMLSVINHRLIRGICDRLRIETPAARCIDFLDRDELAAMAPSQRLVQLCKRAGADRYLSGPSARAYLDVELFSEAGIEVEWMSYEGYPDYPQLWGDFVPRLSIVDLMLNVGADARRLLTQRHMELAH